MLDRKLKSYCICDNCCKQDNCKYSLKVKETIKYFINMPVNIHVPYCNEYESALYNLIRKIEEEKIESIELTDDEMKLFAEKVKENYFKQGDDK